MNDLFGFFDSLINSLSSFPPFIIETLTLVSIIGICVLLIKLFR